MGSDMDRLRKKAAAILARQRPEGWTVEVPIGLLRRLAQHSQWAFEVPREEETARISVAQAEAIIALHEAGPSPEDQQGEAEDKG